jgi:hypothetical protein
MTNEWQPIETAPKDREEILVGVQSDQHFFRYVAYWTGDAWTVWGDMDATRSVKPTHWMPLPSPPSVE